MAFSLAKILILSMLVEWGVRRIRLPGFIGILCVGFLLGPYCTDQVAPNLLAISTDLRLIALVVILLRAGFSIHLQTLRTFGIRLLLLAIIPSLFEALTIASLAHTVFSFSWNSSFTLGFILPAVSPAVIIPFMLQCIEEKRGLEKHIPHLILTAASLDNILNILICNVFISMYAHADASVAYQFVKIPVALFNGLAVGLIVGVILYKAFESYNPRATKRGLAILALALLLVNIERTTSLATPFSGLIATMTIGCIILTRREKIAHEIAAKLSKIWIFAEIILFAVVGAEFNPTVALNAGLAGVLIIFAGVLARSLGVWVALFGGNFDSGEKMAVTAAWLPKASVQAAIGAAPLVAMKAAGLPTGPGETILALATLSILLTAPIGAIAAKKATDRWLHLPASHEHEHHSHMPTQPHEKGTASC
ncbi:MAG TPA: cation:proton antiporter [Candidatus Ozemobacteraceae bacterium]|nr:cation:proton antiporter [Candidatus Ozemobacteraceae bacterium]